MRGRRQRKLVGWQWMRRPCVLSCRWLLLLLLLLLAKGKGQEVGMGITVEAFRRQGNGF